jgi:hypothetical protein
MGLEIAEQADRLRRTRLAPACAELGAEVRPGAGLIQEPGCLEASPIELEQVAGVALEGEAAPCLAAEAHRGIALDPAEGSHRLDHRLSN